MSTVTVTHDIHVQVIELFSLNSRMYYSLTNLFVTLTNQNVACEMYPYIPNWYFCCFSCLATMSDFFFLFILSFFTLIAFASCPENIDTAYYLDVMSFPMRFRFRFHGKSVHGS